jgi:hypothetical protein
MTIRARTPHRFTIHPSIDSLFERIGAIGRSTPVAEVETLREACRGKIRSYPLDSYLRTRTDPIEGRTRYETVAGFTSPRAAPTAR